MKFAICYFANKNDLPFLNTSLRGLEKMISKTVKKFPQISIKTFVCRSAFDDAIFPYDLSTDSCELVVTAKRDNGFSGMVSNFEALCYIYNNFSFDYVIILTPNTVLNSLENIIVVEQHTKRVGCFDEVDVIDSHTKNCLIFSRNGFEKMVKILSKIVDSSSTVVDTLKRRIDRRQSIFNTFSVLKDMFSLCVYYTEVEVHGTTSHVEEDSEKCSLAQTVSFTSTEKMQEHIDKDVTSTNALHEYLKGKRVALVGNAIPDRDCSEEIDKADVVIRFNNFYNYDTNRVGKKVDALILNVLAAFCDDNQIEFNNEVIQNYKPALFIVNESEIQHITKVHNRYEGCEVKMLGNESTDTKYTSGTILLKMISQMDDVKCDVYAFDSDDKWKSYVKNFAKHHQNVLSQEEQMRLEAMKQILKNNEK